MKTQFVEAPRERPVETLSVVRNFRRVIEARDISLMKRELYQFLNLHCGFIAHYDINGFKATYSRPRDFADVFIRHFDSGHRYFSGIYACHQEPYADTGFTKAEIKEAFFEIVETHKDAIAKWAAGCQRSERLNVYQMLKKEFQGELKGVKINCLHCGNGYEVNVVKEGEDFNDFGIVCCLFCGRQIKLY